MLVDACMTEAVPFKGANFLDDEIVEVEFESF